MDPVERTAEIFYKVTKYQGKWPSRATLDELRTWVCDADPNIILDDLAELKRLGLIEAEPEIIKYWTDASQTR